MKDLSVGATPLLGGDVTTLNAIWPGAEAETEAQLGYESGRLAQGYAIALVQQALVPADFRFAGTTLRSGGRHGLPAETVAEDKRRPTVHDDLMRARGAEGYAALQDLRLKDISVTGARRLAKVLPVIRHDADAPPNRQYPMGGGALQWTLIREVPCLIAVRLSADGTAVTPAFTVNLRLAGYEARQRLRRYLQEA